MGRITLEVHNIFPSPSAIDRQIACWKKPNADWQSWFCRNYDSAMPGANDGMNMFVPAGLPEAEAKNLEIAYHIWVDSKAFWDKISDSGKQHKREFQG